MVPARLGKTNILMFSAAAYRGQHFQTSREMLQKTEIYFNEQILSLLNTEGLFDSQAEDALNFGAELLSWKDIGAGEAALMVMTFKYEFIAEDGTVVFSDRIASEGTDDSFLGASRIANSSINSVDVNRGLLAQAIKDNLTAAWHAYVETRDRHQRHIAANLKEENRSMTITTDAAPVRRWPDSNAEEINRLGKNERIQVTGSLPSGWLKASKGGRTLGWIQESAVAVNTPAKTAEKPAAATRSRPIVAVFDIQDASGKFEQDIIVQLTTYLGTVLTQSGKYRVVPRDQLRSRLLEEKKGTYRKCFDETCQIELGRSLAAQKSLATTLIRIGTKCAVTANLFDLKSETTDKGASVETGCSPENLLGAMKQIATQLAE